jgi:pSer/pThr/pTyr-binding forkhead associated (FHA) protein
MNSVSMPTDPVPPRVDMTVPPVALPKPAASVAPEPVGRVVVITKDGGEGPNFPLVERVDIGRAEGEVRFPEDGFLSIRHVRFTARGGKAYLRDLETPNGVYLRVKPNAEIAINNGGFILIGQQVLKLEPIFAEGTTAASEGDALLFGTPAQPRYARLAQRSVEGTTVDVFHLRKAETVLGRESGDIVFSDDPFLSRRHASIRADVANKRFFLKDLGSSNGTFYRVNEGEIEVHHGDQFRIGQQLLRIELLGRK